MKRVLIIYVMFVFFSHNAIMAEKKPLRNSKIQWELNSGVLTISGYGEMPSSARPWEKDNVEKIVIEQGVTAIGNFSFMEHKKVKTVVISNSVTHIKEGAFYGCDELISLEIPNSVKLIEESAFMNCPNLRSIVVPVSVLYIGESAFSGDKCLCITLTNPSTKWGVGAFYNCMLTIINPKSDDYYGINAFHAVKSLSKVYTGNNIKCTVIKEGGKCGLMDSKEKWIIPLENNYYDIEPLVDGFFRVKSSEYGHYGVFSLNGKEIVPTELDDVKPCGKGFLKYKLNGFWGVMNYAGKIIIDTDRGYTSIGNFVTFNKRFAYTMTGYKGECDINGKQISKIKVDTPKQAVVSSSASSSTASGSSSSNSNSSNNSGNKTTTVVVEHHRDPVPVQEWQACFGCGGMGTMGCDNCGGSGTKYIGDRLHRCSRCNGQGIIPCNICYGNKGKYITVYR